MKRRSSTFSGDYSAWKDSRPVLRYLIILPVVIKAPSAVDSLCPAWVEAAHSWTAPGPQPNPLGLTGRVLCITVNTMSVLYN